MEFEVKLEGGVELDKNPFNTLITLNRRLDRVRGLDELLKVVVEVEEEGLE